MLRETAHEMSLIAFEKKQLLQQWKGALIGLARRDEALTAASSALKEAQSAARSAMLPHSLCAAMIPYPLAEPFDFDGPRAIGEEPSRAGTSPALRLTVPNLSLVCARSVPGPEGNSQNVVR